MGLIIIALNLKKLLFDKMGGVCVNMQKKKDNYGFFYTKINAA